MTHKLQSDEHVLLSMLLCPCSAAVGVGIAAGAVARLLQQATLEQKVPFTLRKHTLLLPVFAELLLGQFSFAQVSPGLAVVPSELHMQGNAPQSQMDNITRIVLCCLLNTPLNPYTCAFHGPASTGCVWAGFKQAGSQTSLHSHAPALIVHVPQVLQQPQYRGKALPADHPDSKLIQKIAERIIAAVEEGHGGGFQKHVEKFDVRTEPLL